MPKKQGTFKKVGREGRLLHADRIGIVKTINIQDPLGLNHQLNIPEKFLFLVNHLSPEIRASLEANSYPEAECSFFFGLPTSFQFSDDKDELSHSIKRFLIDPNKGISGDFYLWCLSTAFVARYTMVKML